jgi:hypothetical protein
MGVEIGLTPTFDWTGRLFALLASGMITQQQLRTSPVVPRMITLTILFLEFHIPEIRFLIRTRSVGCEVWFKFINLFHPY